ncbi:MAG TPA: hypothetical protein VFG72_00400 [Marmoricola sp.]|nr:hypothetical protein [Marmoricola sp.]
MVPFAVAVALAVPATAFATLLSIGACIGTPGAGVGPHSVRGAVCDVPALGPWPYTVTVAAAALAVAYAASAKQRRQTQRAAIIAAPALRVFVVPVLLFVLPR